MTNDTNLFTKNVLKGTTEKDLIEAFKEFGEIDVSKVKLVVPNQDEAALKDKIKIETLFGYIKFYKAEDAKKAL